MKEVLGPNNQERWCQRVRQGEMRDEAHEMQSEFFYARYDQFRGREERAEAKQRRTEVYAFCVRSLLCRNYWLPGPATDHTVTRRITNVCASITPVWLPPLFFCVITFLPLHRNEGDNKWIYCPPLYRKLEAKEKEEQEQEQERKIQ
jgi:hypothetical protein